MIAGGVVGRLNLSAGIIGRLGLLLTFIASAWSLISTRRNLTTSKYIETITSERIKWLSTVRNEVAELVTNIQLVISKLQWNITDKDPQYEQWEMYRLESPEEQRKEMESADMSVAVGESEKKWCNTDFIIRLRRLQLRFNPNEDRKIIESLVFFIDFFSAYQKHQDDLQIARGHLKIIIEETQTMLKSEWEKVKKESRGKRKFKK